MWEDGVYLGVRSRSGEVIVADVQGIWKTRSVQRKPFEERWGRKSGDSVQWVPWRMSATDPEVVGERLEVPEMIAVQLNQATEPRPDTLPIRIAMKRCGPMTINFAKTVSR